MLDYTLYSDDKKLFILNFEELEDSYKVNLASGETYTVPKTDDHKENLLKQMELQVKNNQSFFSKAIKEKKSARRWFIYDAVFLGLNFAMAISNGAILNWVCAGIFVLCSAVNIAKFNKYKKLVDDFEKHDLFNRNSCKINNYLTDGSEEKDDNLNIVEEKKEVLTINDVHDMSKQDIRRILDDIERDQTFGIDRPKVLVKTYYNKEKKKS